MARTIRGIDVSHWNGVIDFESVKKSGVEFVIIKAGGSDNGFYIDLMFETNYEKAKSAGLDIGAYYFVGKNFLTLEDAAADANYFLKILGTRQFTMPVFIDVEAPPAGKQNQVTAAIEKFCEIMEESGYFVGVYGSEISGFNDRMYGEILEDKYVLWVARYGTKKPSIGTIWQRSSKAQIPGVKGNCDLDTAYVDYPKIIKEKGFNNIKAVNKCPTCGREM